MMAKQIIDFPNKETTLLEDTHEEALLFEQSTEGAIGVDIEIDDEIELRTGQAPRAAIGLPELSEPQVLRHFVRLSQKNYSIDGGIYPLGSCTMKHNPRVNEKLARLPGFAHIHPLQSATSTQGALALMWELQDWLAKLSGLPHVTLNPAAGAHGELAGLMVIRKAHEAKGKARSIVLVPDSAHGTNPATAAMCGYQVKTIPSKADGTFDLEAFKAALSDEVAALMLTNPNTCGIFEPHIKEAADLLHEVGGYFYCDGANFNAIVGKVRPGDLGVDVMHFNLHKTFSTPHGGGGPGCGPIAVCDSLAMHLPVPFVIKQGQGYQLQKDETQSIGHLRAFQGHFGMAVRALAYMSSHGRDGLKQVAEDAVLAANYILAELKEQYHVPYPQHYCMHEALFTDKKQKKSETTTLDVAKTLIEYGIHPMTVYFPLVQSGAMLVEPTETESKASLDRFIAVMKEIAALAESDPQILKSYPKTTPRRRLDEVRAARNPVLVADSE